MSIKIEFDNIHDFTDVFERAAQQSHRATRAEDALYTANDKIRDLEHRLERIAIPAPIPVPVETVKELLRCFSNDNTAQSHRINMIKQVRLITGLGLKDAKDVVDEVVPYREPSRSA
jgi:type IV secretory pathway ATPase VirB11/archaellum biosynthesis ATPase